MPSLAHPLPTPTLSPYPDQNHNQTTTPFATPTPSPNHNYTLPFGLNTVLYLREILQPMTTVLQGYALYSTSFSLLRSAFYFYQRPAAFLWSLSQV